MRSKIQLFASLFLLILISCKPEMPVTSTIEIEGDGVMTAVNPMLYGVTLEEINHAIDGGLYGELIQNRSFEDGVIPIHCAYDRRQNTLVTPNGWEIPFISPDSIAGWHALTPGTILWVDDRQAISEQNTRSLLMKSNEPGGGAVAEGYGGIAVRKGQSFSFSMYMKSVAPLSQMIVISLRDSSGKTLLSDELRLTPMADWKRIRHTFTAVGDATNAVLVISCETSAAVWIDMVSLFPQKTYMGRANGLRPDLAKAIADLKPSFIRFPGGAFVEGYNLDTYPTFKTTIGSLSDRKHFWNVWEYGTTNGMGFHEYLQFCEDLKAEPVYVVNMGITNQNRRPRYEDITKMDELIRDALDAIAYANAPVDSVYGAMRAHNGHPKPFGLKYLEIGSENYGYEYNRRFYLFRKAIHEIYPDIVLISSAQTLQTIRTDWVDRHYKGTEQSFLSGNMLYAPDHYPRRAPVRFIGEFGSSQTPASGSLGAAIGEACFLIGIEQNPNTVKGIGYSPLLGNVNFKNQGYAPIRFNTHQAVFSPSYYLWKLFSHNRGQWLLKSETQTYLKPQVFAGRAGIELFDNSYEITDARINNQLIQSGSIRTGGWSIEKGRLIPDANKWNYLLIGRDTADYNYSLSVRIRRTKGSGAIQFRVRDNGLPHGKNDYIGWNIGAGMSELFRQSGALKDTLTTLPGLMFENLRWYTLRMECKDDRIRCFLDGRLVQEAKLAAIPSLLAVATRDTVSNELIVKVVNTTLHEEHTALNLHGISVKNEATVIQMTGTPEMRNGFDRPDLVVPEEKQVSFSMQRPIIYIFPPQSITLIKFKMN